MIRVLAFAGALGLVICALGCAALPAPKVAKPARHGYFVESRTTVSKYRARLEARRKFRAALEFSLGAAILSGDLGAAIVTETPMVCADLVDLTTGGLRKLEPEVFVALREAARVRDSDTGASSTEREFLAWQFYDAIVNSARAKVVVKIAPTVEVSLMRSPNVDKALGRVIAVGEGMVPETDLLPEVSLVASERVSELLHAEFEAASATCVDLAFEGVRGRWLAVFKAKV